MASSVQEILDRYNLMDPVDYRRDAALQRLDDKFVAGANQVMTAGSDLDRIKHSILYLRNSDKQAVETIMSFKAQILDTNGREAKKIKKLLNKYLIKQFLDNSHHTLELCEVELLDFIRQANKVISCIKDKDLVRERNTSKLNEAKYDCHRSAEVIFKKVVALKNKHLNLLNQLGEEFKKLDKELKRTRILRKVTQVIFLGFLSVVFACGIIAAVMAIPGVVPAGTITIHPGFTYFIAATSIAQISSEGIKVGQHCLVNMIREFEATLLARKIMIGSMQSGTEDAITVLDDIVSHVEKVLERGNDPQLIVSEEPAVIQFKKEIEELEMTRKDCIADINRARDKVVEEYTNLKNMLRARERK